MLVSVSITNQNHICNVCTNIFYGIYFVLKYLLQNQFITFILKPFIKDLIYGQQTTSNVLMHIHFVVFYVLQFERLKYQFSQIFTFVIVTKQQILSNKK